MTTATKTQTTPQTCAAIEARAHTLARERRNALRDGNPADVRRLADEAIVLAVDAWRCAHRTALDDLETAAAELAEARAGLAKANKHLGSDIYPRHDALRRRIADLEGAQSQCGPGDMAVPIPARAATAAHYAAERAEVDSRLRSAQDELNVFLAAILRPALAEARTLEGRIGRALQVATCYSPEAGERRDLREYALGGGREAAADRFADGFRRRVESILR